MDNNRTLDQLGGQDLFRICKLNKVLGGGGYIYHLVSHEYDCLVDKEKTRTKNQVSLLELSELTLFTSMGNAKVQGTMWFTDTSIYWQFLRKEEFEGNGSYSSDGMTVPQSAKGILGSELMGSHQVSHFRPTVLVGRQWSAYCLFSGARSPWQQENAQPCYMIWFGSIANSRLCANFPGSKYTMADNLSAHWRACFFEGNSSWCCSLAWQ